MTNFSMYFQQICHGTPGWATCPFFVLFFCTEVRMNMMNDLKSAVHRLKSFAQDAAQAGRALAQGVPGGLEGWPLMRVARGKHHITLEKI